MNVVLDLDNPVEIRSSVNLYQVHAKEMAIAEADGIASTFSMLSAAEVSSDVARYTMGTQTLELFRRSSSWRWQADNGGLPEAAAAPLLPTTDQATTMAAGALATFGQQDDAAKLSGTSFTHQRNGVEGGVGAQLAGEAYPIALHVNYGFWLDDLPVFGPGAKIQVTFVHPNGPFEALMFWRKPGEFSTIGIISPQEALALLPTIGGDGASAADITIIVRQMRLGYYSLPPREAQPTLIPVYALKCVSVTGSGQEVAFRRHIVAADTSDQDVKSICAPLPLIHTRIF